MSNTVWIIMMVIGVWNALLGLLMKVKAESNNYDYVMGLIILKFLPCAFGGFLISISARGFGWL